MKSEADNFDYDSEFIARHTELEYYIKLFSERFAEEVMQNNNLYKRLKENH